MKKVIKVRVGLKFIPEEERAKWIARAVEHEVNKLLGVHDDYPSMNPQDYLWQINDDEPKEYDEI